MTVFTVHRGGRAGPLLVPDRFSWAGLLFGPLFLAAAGAWLGFLLYVAAELAMFRFGAPSLVLVLHAATALSGHDWRRFELRLGGWTEDGIVVGAGRDHALLRLAERAT